MKILAIVNKIKAIFIILKKKKKKKKKTWNAKLLKMIMNKFI